MTGRYPRLSFSYDAASNLTGYSVTAGTQTFSVAYGYDQAGRVTSLTTPGGQTASFVLGGNGRLESASLGTSLKQVVAYDAANKTTSLEYSVPTGTVLLKETYACDGEGNRTSVVDSAGRVATFTYDQLNRLSSETDPVTGEKRVYEYDPAGNRTKKTIFASDGALLSSTSYAYNQANELVSIDGAPVTTMPMETLSTWAP